MLTWLRPPVRQVDVPHIGPGAGAADSQSISKPPALPRMGPKPCTGGTLAYDLHYLIGPITSPSILRLSG